MVLASKKRDDLACASPLLSTAPDVDVNIVALVRHPINGPNSKAKATCKKRFIDARLSDSGHLACANCQDAELGWSDSRIVSFGHARNPSRDVVVHEVARLVFDT